MANAPMDVSESRVGVLGEVRGPRRIVLGGPFGERPDAASFAILDDFVEAGGRVVETAHAYAEGAGERQLGRWLAASGQLNMVCITKVGHPPAGSTRVAVERLAEQIEQSAERLQVDRVDVVLLHRDDPSRTVEEQLEPLLAARRKGLAGAVGVANWGADRVAQALGACGPGGMALASSHLSLAVPSGPLWPGVVTADRSLLDLHSREGLPLLAWSANARGWFASSGRESDQHLDEDSRRVFATALNERRRAACRAVARRIGVRPAIVALAWTLSTFPFVLAAVGPRNRSEVDDAVAAAALSLSPADLATLTEQEETICHE